MELHFKLWFEVGMDGDGGGRPGGGMEPPKQNPIDPNPAPGQTDAFARYHGPNSNELPPTPRNPAKKKMKSKAK